MSKKKNEVLPLEPPIADVPAAIARLSMRLAAGRHAVKATEVEILIDGMRLTGGNGIVEFDLFAETWVELRVISP
jgi:hypothetical protein